MNAHQIRMNRVRNAQLACERQTKRMGMYILKTYLVRRQETGCGEMEFTIRVHEVNGQAKFDVNEASDDHEA